MGLFGKKKTCSCGGKCGGDETKAFEDNVRGASEANGRGVKILGSGCAKCNQLEEQTRLAMDELGIEEEIEHVRDFEKIAMFGVMTTPALVIDSKVVAYGKVLKKDEIIPLFQQR